MKIVKRGNKPEEEIWFGICQTCGTEVTADRKEIDVNEYSLGGKAVLNGTNKYALHKCPVCKKNGTAGLLFYKNRLIHERRFS